jgi:hypothetical protein
MLYRTRANANLRRHRERRRSGRRVYRLELDEVQVETMLEAEGLLPTATEHSHQQVEQALAYFVGVLGPKLSPP